MKKIGTVIGTLALSVMLVACGNQNNSANNRSQTTSSSQSSSTHQGADGQSSSSTSLTNNNQTAGSSSQQAGQQGQKNKVMTTEQVVARVAQLKNVNLNGGDKIYVTPTNTPNVFKIYIKGANQDPQVDSIVDHYVYNGNTDVLSQATER